MKKSFALASVAVLVLVAMAEAQIKFTATTTSAPTSRPAGGMRIIVPQPGWESNGTWPLEIEMELKVEKIKVAYLGLSAVPVDEPLRQQLSLPDGVGLLVDHLDGDGPAKAAGIERLDVLHKINDQLLVNPPQLQVLVRMQKPGDEVKLTVIRKAKPQVITIKLTEKEVPKNPPPMPGMQMGPGGVIPEGRMQPGLRWDEWPKGGREGQPGGPMGGPEGGRDGIRPGGPGGKPDGMRGGPGGPGGDGAAPGRPGQPGWQPMPGQPNPGGPPMTRPGPKGPPAGAQGEGPTGEGVIITIPGAAAN